MAWTGGGSWAGARSDRKCGCTDRGWSPGAPGGAGQTAGRFPGHPEAWRWGQRTTILKKTEKELKKREKELENGKKFWYNPIFNT